MNNALVHLTISLLNPVAGALDALTTTVVHPDYFPYLLAPTLHAARISIAYQINSRKSPTPLPWATYIGGFLIMAWGGGFFVHLILGLPPPMLHATGLWINYIAVHLFLTAFFSIYPGFLYQPFLDTILFPVDGLLRTTAVMGALSLLSNPAFNVDPKYISSPLTHALLGAVASAGGGYTAATLNAWTSNWSFGTPVFLRGVGLLGTLDAWGGALVAILYGLATGHPAFSTLSFQLKTSPLSFGVLFVLNPRGAKALGAVVFSILFGFRAWATHWRSSKPQPRASPKKKTQ
ncbi:hypothetical protein AX16_001220 [Volvariella volvacea WC 439]|nr:hypothetical protein AX16_001220 [Volvariella volvacea WC 439]